LFTTAAGGPDGGILDQFGKKGTNPVSSANEYYKGGGGKSQRKFG
jgi:hypothetical protein